MLTSVKQLRVFVVDDEDVIASTLAMILRYSGGFHATFFNSPTEALEAARCDPPDLLVSDVVMPALAGIELALKNGTYVRNARCSCFRDKLRLRICLKLRGSMDTTSN